MRLAIGSVLVTISGLFLSTAAHGQTAARGAQPAALPPLPASAPATTTTTQAAPTPVPMVAVTPADAPIDCASAAGDPRCPSVQLTQPTVIGKPKTRSHWYGWQTLITDGAALAMLIGAVAAKDDKVGNTLAPIAGLTYVFGGPIVHWAHRHGGMGAASLGLRLGAPIGLALVGYAIGTAADGGKRNGLDSAALAGTAIGFLIGFPTAIALDASLLAREDVEDEAPDAQVKLKPQRPWFVVQPDVQTSRTGAQVGVRGTF